MRNEMNQINALIKQNRLAEADAIADKVVKQYPSQEHGWVQKGRIAQLMGNVPSMLAHSSKAKRLAPKSVLAGLMCAEAELLSGKIAEAKASLKSVMHIAKSDARGLQHAAELYTHLGDYQEALTCYERAHGVIGDDAGLLYNMATALSAIGEQDKAEGALNEVIANNPKDYAAYYNRSVLKKRSAQNNSCAEMEKRLSEDPNNPGAIIQLGYGLAKEYEDMEDYPKAFEYLKRGADARKALLSYDVRGDVDSMRDICAVMEGSFFDDLPAENADAGPIFILGQPRSGTTLVDRIISSHSTVHSLGEINDFAIALMSMAPSAQSKADLIAATKDMDCAEIGAAYLKTTCQRGQGFKNLIDKTPANFLYIGLIAKALPSAKIIHLTRHPMDSCYAMYKTLFRMGYPYSYNLEDLAAYYIAYHHMMNHWREQLLGRFLDIAYEDLVSDQERQSRRLIEHCGLAWEDACLDFHKNSSAAATASAAQVRQPIYTSSVQKWRNYEEQLAPLAEALRSAGINID